MCVLCGRSWRTVWTRLSQGENQCGFGFSLKARALLISRVGCCSGNSHLWVWAALAINTASPSARFTPGALPRAVDGLSLQALTQPTPALSHAAFVGAVYYRLRPTH